MTEAENKENMGTEVLELVREDSRECSIIKETPKIAYLLKEYILGKPLFVKNTLPPVAATLGLTEDPNVLTLTTPLDFEAPSDTIMLHLTYKRHMELSCAILEKLDTGYKIQITEALIANKPRTDKRLAVSQHDVFGHHFYISKNKIDVSPISFSVSNKVIFKDAERTMSARFPFIKICEMDAQNDSLEKKIIKKHGKGLFVSSITIDSETEFEELGTIPIKEALGDSYTEVKKDLVNKGVKSWLIRPILYTNVKGEEFPIGYFLLKSTDKVLGVDDYNNLAEEEKKIVDRIKDSNTILLNKKYPILNISLGGALIEVDDEEFQGYLVQRTDMTFDLLFKYMAGLRFYARIHHIHKKPNGSMLIGLGFHGIVYTGGPSVKKSKKLLEESLAYLLKQGASYI